MPASLTISVSEIRPHPSVVRNEADAEHHRNQWAICVRVAYGNVVRTHWRWMDGDAPPTIEQAERHVARELALEQTDIRPESAAWWRGETP